MKKKLQIFEQKYESSSRTIEILEAMNFENLKKFRQKRNFEQKTNFKFSDKKNQNLGQKYAKFRIKISK